MAIAAIPEVAHPAKASQITEAEAGTLGADGYLWDPSSAPEGRTVMVVKLDSQRAFVWRNRKLIGISMTASGKPGYETPDGSFTVLEKQRDHHSNKYDDAPMPYMQRLTWSGLALHGGHPRGYPASHGCIRLPMGFAAALFKENTRGMQVVITGHASSQQNTTIASRGNARPPSNDADDESGWQATTYGSDANAPREMPSPAENNDQENGSAYSDGDQEANQAVLPPPAEQRDNTGDQQPSEDLPPPPN